MGRCFGAHRSSRNGWPTGADFSCFFAAGALALKGRAGDVCDPAAQNARELAMFGANTPYYGWRYPLMFFFSSRLR